MTGATSCFLPPLTVFGISAVLKYKKGEHEIPLSFPRFGSGMPWCETSKAACVLLRGYKHAIDLFGHQGLNLPDLTEPKGQQVCYMLTRTSRMPWRICRKDNHFYETNYRLACFTDRFFYFHAAKKTKACAKSRHRQNKTSKKCNFLKSPQALQSTSHGCISLR